MFPIDVLVRQFCWLLVAIATVNLPIPSFVGKSVVTTLSVSAVDASVVDIVILTFVRPWVRASSSSSSSRLLLPPANSRTMRFRTVHTAVSYHVCHFLASTAQDERTRIFLLSLVFCLLVLVVIVLNSSKALVTLEIPIDCNNSKMEDWDQPPHSWTLDGKYSIHKPKIK